MKTRYNHSYKNTCKTDYVIRKEINEASFSTELKPSTSNSIAKCSHHQVQNQDLEYCKKRIRSAKVSANPNPLHHQINSCWNSRKSIDMSDIKWIGVHRNTNNEGVHRQAFPARKHRSADQSFANFVMKYGRKLNNHKQTRQQLKLNISDGWVSSGATKKVKARLTWFQRKRQDKKLKPECSKHDVEVLWIRSS